MIKAQEIKVTSWVLITSWILLITPAAVSADAVKLGNFWIKGVTVHNITNNQLYYYNDIGDEFIKPLSQLQGLKLERYPQLERYETAAAHQDDPAALEAVNELLQLASEPWVQQWARFLLISIYDRLGQPEQALEMYLQLAYSGGETHYLTAASLDSVASAEGTRGQDLRARVESAAFELSGQPQAQPVEQLLARFRSTDRSDPSNASNPRTTTDAPPPPADQAQVDPTQAPSNRATSISLPRALDLGDAITKMILSGHYDQAVTTANRTLATDSRQIGMRLFQRGIAQMRLAEATDNRDAYLDAGLSFMQVVIHAPDSNFVGPSLVEAGWVHCKIGQADVARRLLDQAVTLIDTEDDAHYAQRLDQLIAQLADLP